MRAKTRGGGAKYSATWEKMNLRQNLHTHPSPEEKEILKISVKLLALLFTDTKSLRMMRIFTPGKA